MRTIQKLRQILKPTKIWTLASYEELNRFHKILQFSGRLDLNKMSIRPWICPRQSLSDLPKEEIRSFAEWSTILTRDMATTTEEEENKQRKKDLNLFYYSSVKRVMRCPQWNSNFYSFAGDINAHLRIFVFATRTVFLWNWRTIETASFCSDRLVWMCTVKRGVKMKCPSKDYSDPKDSLSTPLSLRKSYPGAQRHLLSISLYFIPRTVSRVVVFVPLDVYRKCACILLGQCNRSSLLIVNCSIFLFPLRRVTRTLSVLTVLWLWSATSLPFCLHISLSFVCSTSFLLVSSHSFAMGSPTLGAVRTIWSAD